jgi:hypothetical protein
MDIPILKVCGIGIFAELYEKRLEMENQYSTMKENLWNYSMALLTIANLICAVAVLIAVTIGVALVPLILIIPIIYFIGIRAIYKRIRKNLSNGEEALVVILITFICPFILGIFIQFII